MNQITHKVEATQIATSPSLGQATGRLLLTHRAFVCATVLLMAASTPSVLADPQVPEHMNE